MLTEEQLHFLALHRVPLGRVVDARRLSGGERERAMALQDAWIASGADGCPEAGHRLRARGGECAQCHPAAIETLRRHCAARAVYVAWSDRDALAMIGASSEPHDCVLELNRRGHAGIADWQLYSAHRCAQASQVEPLAQWKLRRHAQPRRQESAGVEREWYGLFSCGAHRADRAVVDAIEEVLDRPETGAA